MLSVWPVIGIGEIGPGCDIAREVLTGLAASDLHPEPGDAVVVTQKIISKAEDRFVSLDVIVPGDEALRLAEITGKDPRLVEVILSESAAVVRAVPGVLLTRHRCGWVMANAGIDRSNLGLDRDDQVLLLPRDADASATAIAGQLRERLGFAVGVIVSDSFGRPWRNGVVNVALGVAGLPSLVDQRGNADRDGRPLEVTQIALGDMAASAAGLVMGEGAEGVCAALVRGLPYVDTPARAGADLNRPLDEDLFQ